MTQMTSFYKYSTAIMGLLFHLLARVEITGLENVPREGNFILLVNHLHWSDVPLMGAVIPRQLVVFAGERWARRWPMNWVLTYVGHAIYVRRGEVDRRALRAALKVLEEGLCLGVAPEGTRSRTGGLIEAKAGAAYLATRSGVTMLPAVSWGQERIFKELPRGRRAVIRVSIGKPFRFPESAREARGEELKSYTEEIMQTLAGMLPEAYRGIYR